MTATQKFVTPRICRELHSNRDHTELSSLQDHNAFKGVSSSFQHRSHNEFIIMCLRFGFDFVGMAS